MIGFDGIVKQTNNYDDSVSSLLVLSLALSGEVGEFHNKLKKAYHRNLIDNKESREVLLDELGDVLWYLTALIHHLDSDLSFVMEQNAIKVMGRHAAGEQYNSKVVNNEIND